MGWLLTPIIGAGIIWIGDQMGSPEAVLAGTVILALSMLGSLVAMLASK